jgi:hypothetical protein
MNFLREVVRDPTLVGTDANLAGRVRIAFKLAISRMIKDSTKVALVVQDLYPGISKAAFDETLATEARVEFVNTLAIIYASLPEEDRLSLRKKFFDAYFSPTPLDPPLPESLLNLIAAAKKLDPDKAGVLKNIDEKLQTGDSKTKVNAEALLGRFLFEWPVHN